MKLNDPYGKEPLELLELTEIGDRVKSMDIVSLSQGNFFFFKSREESHPRHEMRLLEKVEILILSFHSFFFLKIIDHRQSIVTSKL